MPELPEYERRKTGTDFGDRDAQIAALTEIIGNLAKNLRRVEDKINQVAKKATSAQAPEAEEDPSEPGSWVWFTPPAAAEDDPDGDEDPRFTVENFVTWYNLTFVGIGGGRSRLIPDCWRKHPGLAMEVAALAYTWRAANIGPDATARDAQYWMHQWRPGFADRLARDWVSPDCLDGDHHDVEPAARDDRFALAEQHAAAVERAGQLA